MPGQGVGWGAATLAGRARRHDGLHARRATARISKGQMNQIRYRFHSPLPQRHLENSKAILEKASRKGSQNGARPDSVPSHVPGVLSTSVQAWLIQAWVQAWAWRSRTT